MMGADHSAVDHLQGSWNQPALVQGFQYPFPQPDQRPAPELAVDRRSLAELFGQVTPWRTCSRDPENPIQNKAIVRGLAPVRGAAGHDEAFVKRPFLVRHQVSCQAGLHSRYQIESRSARSVNPFCQHGLGLNLRPDVRPPVRQGFPNRRPISNRSCFRPWSGGSLHRQTPMCWCRF